MSHPATCSPPFYAPAITTAEELDAARTAVGDCLRKLAAQGSTEAIAIEVGSHAIAAVCGRPEECAVAVYVAHMTGYEVAVAPDVVILLHVAPALTMPRTPGATLPMSMLPPKAITDFVLAFDEHRFPELELATILRRAAAEHEEAQRG